MFLGKDVDLIIWGFGLFTFDRVACVEATFAQYYPVLSESQIKLWVIEICTVVTYKQAGKVTLKTGNISGEIKPSGR